MESGRKRRGAGGMGCGDCCRDVETLNVSKARRTGTGAIHQEIFMISRFSAPQIQCWQH